MLHVTTDNDWSGIETALRQAAQRHQATIHHLTHVGHHLQEKRPEEDAISFAICAPELYTPLLEAEIRMAAFLPWNIAACRKDGRVTFEAVSPVECCRTMARLDLIPLATPVEAMLRAVMEDAAREQEPQAKAATAAYRGGLGATEEQMSARGAIPQRIDNRGTKVEELGGTGEHDAQGG